MSDVLAQERKDIASPIRPRIAGLGLVELRPPRLIENRTEYGMGHAWRVLKLGRLKIWLRAEVER